VSKYRIDINRSKILTGYAVDTRYPGMYEPVSEGEYKEALNLAVGVFEWAAKIINLNSVPL